MAVGDQRPPGCFVRRRAEVSFIHTHVALAQRTPSAHARSARECPEPVTDPVMYAIRSVKRPSGNHSAPCQYHAQPQGPLRHIDHRPHPPVAREHLQLCLQFLATLAQPGPIHLRRPWLQHRRQPILQGRSVAPYGAVLDSPTIASEAHRPLQEFRHRREKNRFLRDQLQLLQDQNWPTISLLRASIL